MKEFLLGFWNDPAQFRALVRGLIVGISSLFIGGPPYFTPEKIIAALGMMTGSSIAAGQQNSTGDGQGVTK